MRKKVFYKIDKDSYLCIKEEIQKDGTWHIEKGIPEKCNLETLNLFLKDSEYDCEIREQTIREKVFEILTHTNCGCCNSPWFNEELYNELQDIFREEVV